MSKYVEIEIRLTPAYGSGGLQGEFPNLARRLKDWNYTAVLEKEPSLYHLVDVLARIRQDPKTSAFTQRPLPEMIERLQKVRDEAREHLLARRLNELDKILYRLEDLFEDLEKELQWQS